MDRLFFNSYMTNYNEHKYIANDNVDVLCICAIYCTSVTLPVPGRRIPHLCPSGYFRFPKRFSFKFFLTQVEGLKQRCDFGL